jgi:hypothetical protein
MNKTELEKEVLKIRYVGTGICPQCNKEYVKDGEITHAVCTCKSVVLIKLAPAVILPPKLARYFDDLAKQCGCTADDILNKCFEVGLENLEKRLLAKE